MIHHYINLVCWRSMLDIYVPSRDVVWVDTVSMHKLVARFRSCVEYRPGTSALNRIGPGAPDGGKWFFLTAMPLEKLAPERQYKLPAFTEISVPDELTEVLRNLEPGTRVGIGISSPKQNRLAVALHALRPDLEYHCLGAALAGLNTFQEGATRNSTLSGSGLEWLWFLLISPRRTWAKIIATLREGWAVQMHAPSIEAFEKFASICAPARHNGPSCREKGN